MTKRHYLLHRSIARISMVLQDMSPGDYALRAPVDLRLLIALPVRQTIIRSHVGNRGLGIQF